MRDRRHNFAVIKNESAPEEPITKDKDGTEDDDDHTAQLIVDTSENGFILSVMGGEETQSLHKVYLYEGQGESGPHGLVQDIIDSLGLTHKVRIQK